MVPELSEKYKMLKFVRPLSVKRVLLAKWLRRLHDIQLIFLCWYSASNHLFLLVKLSILCTVYLERRWDCHWNFSILILIASVCARTPLSPDNFKRVIKDDRAFCYCAS